jgi:hypothetical protein
VRMRTAGKGSALRLRTADAVATARRARKVARQKAAPGQSLNIGSPVTGRESKRGRLHVIYPDVHIFDTIVFPEP